DVADVFVLPTYWDSFGMVFLEAISFGLPIISTQLYTLPELVENGASGLLIALPIRYYEADFRASRRNWNKEGLLRSIGATRYPQTEQAVYDALCRLMDADLRARMAANARERFRCKFRRDLRDQAFLDVFRNGDAP